MQGKAILFNSLDCTKERFSYVENTHKQYHHQLFYRTTTINMCKAFKEVIFKNEKWGIIDWNEGTKVTLGHGKFKKQTLGWVGELWEAMR